ncbi:MAG: hypothetical protein J6Y85_05380 [Alphaproteobacteria bacterium]|nr:hypothetical protein [Alphaproteobacteria bacterium]
MSKFFFLLGCLMWALHVWAGFVPGTEDIPALGDMIFSEDVTSFDVPQGQILIVMGTTSKSPNEIERFYRNNLQALGWTLKKSGKFVRGNDVLEIETTSQNSKQNVKFSLTLSNE